MNNWIYILCMAGVTFLIRVIPLTPIRKPIKNTEKSASASLPTDIDFDNESETVIEPELEIQPQFEIKPEVEIKPEFEIQPEF